MRQKIGDLWSISTQNIFTLSSVTPKPPKSPYGAKQNLFGRRSSPKKSHTKTKKGPHGAQQSSNFLANWGHPSFPENIFCWGSFFEMDFRRRPFNQKPLVFRKNPRTHLEVQWSFGDELTFQECQKSWIFKKPTIRWGRKLETRGLFRRRISFRSVLACQNGLNRYMGQHIVFLQKIQFFVFWPCSAFSVH